jgi:RHS repeat-associated protein
VNFTWSDLAPSGSYRLDLCNDLGLTACTSFATSSLSYPVPVSYISQNATMYWRVWRYDEAGWAAGPVASFSVSNTLAPAPILQPAGPDGYVTTTSPSLTITPVADADGDTVVFRYRVCDQPNGAGNCTGTPGYTTATTWAASIQWATKYFWTVEAWDQLPTGQVYLGGSGVTATTPTASVMWSLGGFPNGAPSGVIDTSSGNVHFKEVDVDPATVGTEIGVLRSYNSLDTNTRSFGRGWTVPIDMVIEKSLDMNSVENGVSVLMPDGRMEFHGKNPDGSYAVRAFGYTNDLAFNSATGEFTLTDEGKTVYRFSNIDGATSPNTFEITSITDNDGNQTTITGTTATRVVRDTASGRQVTYNLSTPVGASRAHVTSVVSDSVAAHGGALTWTYTYTGDQLNQVCSPDIDPTATVKTLCTVYTYDPTTLAVSKVETPQVKNGSPTNKKVRFEIVYTNGRPTAQKDGLGNQWTYAYASNTTTGITIPKPISPDPNGLWTDVARLQTTITDPLGNITNVYFDSQRRLIYQRDPVGGEMWFRWDAAGFLSHNVERLTPTKVVTTLTVNDAKGRTTQRTDPDGSVLNWTYNDSNKVLTETDPFGKVTTNTYDANLAGTANQGTHLLTKTLPATADHAAPVFTYEYTNATTPAVDGAAGERPPLWLPSKTTDPRGGVTTMEYNKAGDLRRTTNPVGLKMEYLYDELGRKTTEKIDYDGALQTVSTVTYDAVSRPVQVDGPPLTNPVTNQVHRKRTSTVYDDNGNPLTVTLSDIGGSANPDASRVTTYRYDNANREDSVKDPLNNTMSRVYDAAGRVTEVVDQRGTRIVTGYDGRGLATSTTLKNFIDDPVTPGTPRDVVLSTTQYDLGGRPTLTTDSAGRVTVYAFDDMDRELNASLYSSITAYNQNPFDPVQVLRTATYDKSRMTTKTAFGDLNGLTIVQVQNVSFTYDDLGRVKTQAIANTASNGVTSTTNQTVTNYYDATSNVVRSVTSGGSTSSEVRAQYDIANRATLSVQENGAVDIAAATTYDKRGLAVSVTGARGVTLGANDVPTVNAAFSAATVYDLAGRAVQTNAPAVDRVLADRTTGNATVATAQTPISYVGYTTFGEPTSAKDPNGNITTTAYDLLGRKSTITYPSYTPPGGTAIVPTETFVYDQVGNLTQRTDRRGKNTTWVFDMRNRVVKQTDPTVGALPAGVTRIKYDDASNKVETTNPVGAVTFAQYNELNWMTSQTVRVRNGANPSTDAVTTFQYDYQGDVISQCLPVVVTGQTRCTISTYSPLGQVLTVTPPLGGVTRYHYDGLNRPTGVTDSLGRATSTDYDIAGRATRTSRLENGVPSTTQAVAYDAAGNMTAATSAQGGRTTYSYDNLNRLTSVTKPVIAGPLAWYRLNETTGTAAADSSGNNIAATYSAVSLGQPAATGGAAGNTASATFAPGLASQVTSSDQRLDISGDLTIQAWIKSTDNGNWQMIATRADSNGQWNIPYEFRLTPDGRLSFEQTTALNVYDSVASAGAVPRNTRSMVTVTRRAGKIDFYIGATKQVVRNSANTADSNGILGQATSTPGTLTRIGSRSDGFYFNGSIDEVAIYDRALAPNQITENPAASQNLPAFTFSYDLNGNQTRTVDGRSNSWLNTYNSWNLVQDRIEPSTTAHPALANRRFTTTYDAGGLPVKDVLPGAVTVNRTFDNVGNMIQEASVAATDAAAATRTFTYDQAGRMITMSHPTSTATLAWNDRNQLTAVTGPAVLASSFAYDGAGRMTQRVDAAGTTTYTWDANSRLDLETDPLTGSTRDYSWNTANQVTGVTYGAAGSSVSRVYTYDGLGRLATDTTTTAAGVLLRSVGYGYDLNDNVVAETIGGGGAGGGSHSYKYDASDRLTSWTSAAGATTAYGWDANGNRTAAGAVTAAFDQRNRLLTSGTETYTWTPRGTMKSKTVSAVATNYVFDGLGRMTGAGGVAYSYDAMNRVAARATVPFSYSGLDPDPSKDGTTGAAVNTIAHSPSGDAIALKVGAGAGQVIGEDRHGDVTALFTPAATSVSDTVDYDPFGVPTARTGSTANRVGFQSDYTDPASGLVNMGARWYAPAAGVFTARDSYSGVLGSPVTLNRYTYANDNPMSYFDPDGLCAVRIDGDYCIGKKGKNGRVLSYKQQVRQAVRKVYLPKTEAKANQRRVDANRAREDRASRGNRPVNRGGAVMWDLMTACSGASRLAQLECYETSRTRQTGGKQGDKEDRLSTEILTIIGGLPTSEFLRRNNCASEDACRRAVVALKNGAPSDVANYYRSSYCLSEEWANCSLDEATNDTEHNVLFGSFESLALLPNPTGAWTGKSSPPSPTVQTPKSTNTAGGWLDDAATAKVPSGWGPGAATKKGVGTRWTDPANPGNGVRIDQGNPLNTQITQQVDHVVVRYNGQVIGRNGQPISGSIAQNAEQAHIPLSEWQTWKSWFAP